MTRRDVKSSGGHLRSFAKSALLPLYVACSSAGMVGGYVLALRTIVPFWVPVYFAVASGLVLLASFYAHGQYRHGASSAVVPTTVWVSVIASHLLLVFLPPLLSDDVWRYLFDGLLQQNGFHPWSYPPSSPKIADLVSTLDAPVNQGHLRSVYPPFAELLFAANAWLGSSLLLWKSAMFACALTTATLVGRRFGQFPALLFLGHPLTMLAVSSEGHVDSAGILLLYASVALPMALWKRAAIFAAAIATKLIPLFALPVFLAHHRRSWLRVGMVIIITLVVVSAPYIAAGTDSVQTLGSYLSSWSFNGSIAPVSIHMLRSAIESFTENSTFELAPLTALNAWLGHSTIYNGQATFSSWWTATELAERLYRGISLAALLTTALYATRAVASSRSTIERGTLTVLLAWLLLSPVVHPWYVLWVLPLSFAAGRAGVLAQVWSVAVLISYLTPARYLATGHWSQPLAEQLLEYGMLVGLTAALWKLSAPESHN